MPGAAAFPGTFNPPTVAHLAIAEAALHAAELDRVDLVVSEVSLGKEHLEAMLLDQRLAVLREVAVTRPWLGVVRTSHQLLADIAAGYDAVVVGADKWDQVQDPAWYEGSVAKRDAALARLPLAIVFTRPPSPEPEPVPGRVLVLALGPGYEGISSTGARAGRREWMLQEAAAWDERTGTWTVPPADGSGGGGRSLAGEA